MKKFIVIFSVVVFVLIVLVTYWVSYQTIIKPRQIAGDCHREALNNEGVDFISYETRYIRCLRDNGIDTDKMTRYYNIDGSR